MEKLLEAERAQLPPWIAVGFGTGIAAWFTLGAPYQWQAFLCLAAALTLLGFGVGRERASRAVGWFSVAAALGCGLVWVRAEWVAGPRLDRPMVTTFSARVEAVDHLAAKKAVRLLLTPADRALPPTVRVSIDEDDMPSRAAPGSVVQLKARLVPPPPMALPGSYDFARDAWFKGIGAVGKAIGPVSITSAAGEGGMARVRDDLRRHIAGRLSEQPSGIAIALATGDQNAVGEADAEAMRRSGLTHLLSVSGLHIAAVVAFTMWLTLRLLAMSETLALRFNLVLVAAAAAAAAGVGYTLLTGAQVPTVRSCVAALLVLGGIALGREAISIRLIATGAIVVLLFRPEALAGASFQMSFAAVTAIVALHSAPWAKRLLERRDEGMFARTGRVLVSMVLTGLAVELALIPLALFHFHRAGLYGVAANIVAIPLTTFVIMPLEAGALLLDAMGVGKPLWMLCGLSIDGLLWLAHEVAAAKGAVAMLPSIPGWAFALMVAGGLWLCLWTTRIRIRGIVPALIGALGALTSHSPDLLVTGDGKHLAIVDKGTPYLLRDRTGDYMRDLVAEASGYDGEVGQLAARPYSDCSRDACLALIQRGGREWRLLATRSFNRIDWQVIVRACADADIVVSDRRLPRGCVPRWLKLDRTGLERAGGLAIYLGGSPHIDSAAERVGSHPWAQVSRSQ